MCFESANARFVGNVITVFNRNQLNECWLACLATPECKFMSYNSDVCLMQDSATHIEMGLQAGENWQYGYKTPGECPESKSNRPIDLMAQ